MRLNRFREKAMQGVFFLTAVTSIAAVVIICIFLFCNGVPAMAEIGFFDFVGGQKWAPTNVPASYGIFDMIIASIYVTAGAIIIGVPIEFSQQYFLQDFALHRFTRCLNRQQSFWQASRQLFTASSDLW